MKDYLFLFRGGDSARGSQSPDEMQKHMQKWVQWMGDLGKQGKLISGQPLQKEGKVVSGNRKKITDGPFAEGKEIVGGYLMVKAKDLNDAVEISKDCPIFEHEGIVEVREVQEMPVM